MSFAIGERVPWTIPPDWKAGVRESLAWLTTALPARSGPTQKRRMRLAPRRSFTFDLITGGQERRVVDALLFDRGARVYDLPIVHDLQLLPETATLGDSVIACDTVGYEFVAGGRAMLWRGVNTFELIDLVAVETAQLSLAIPLVATWPRGTRLYPIRAARALDPGVDRARNDDLGKRSLQFVIDETCDWAASAPIAEYRDYPVLEIRTDEGEDPASNYARVIESVDNETGPLSYADFANAAFRSTNVQVFLTNRAQHVAFRSLLYWFEGRAESFWLPSWSSDLQLVAAITGARTTLSVEWCGYTVFGRMQANRRDLRIELKDGTIHYRRIIGSVEVGNAETLTIDSALPADIAVGQVRQLSFLTFSELASDTVELEHLTDAAGLTRSTLAFAGVKDDV